MRGAITLIWMIAGCRSGAAPPPALEAPPTPVVTGPRPPLAAHFGVWREVFERTQHIPKVEGVTFGWRIKTRCTGPVKFTEVMRLPAPGDWSFEPSELPGTKISEDGTTTTTTDYAACKQGWVEHRWTIAAEDPAGTYVITVALDGYATTVFRPKFSPP